MPRVADPPFAPDCTISFDGQPVAARAGESVAAALLAAGHRVIARSAKYHRPRGAFCLAGTCHGCVARVDGTPSQRTCLVPCRPGMAVETQNAVPGAGHDLLGAIDVVYPRGLDHHHLATWSVLANRAAVAVSRRLAGAGTLSSAGHGTHLETREEDADALVVGGGPAGLGAAEVLAGAGRRIVLAEAGAALGGRLRSGLHPPPDAPAGWVSEVARAVAAAGGTASAACSVVGIWRDGGPFVAVLREGGAEPRLRVIRPRAIVIATGTTALPPVFPRNDLPGIFDVRGAARALAEEGLLPGWRCVVAGGGPDAAALAERLRGRGCEVVEAGAVAAARGGRRLGGVALVGGERVTCDALMWCGARAPASDLGRLLGAEAEATDAGWALRVGPRGETAVPALWAAGEVVGPVGVTGAAAAGRRCGEAAAGHR